METSTRIRSFFAGYFLVPAAFYAVNAVGHAPPFEVAFPVILTVVLIATAAAAFRALEHTGLRILSAST